jgi:hypothetical protein
VIDYKYQNLSNQRFKIFESWAETFALQLVSNEFTVNDPHKNTFTWFIDQINHSGPVAQSKMAVQVKEICQAASKNSQEYSKLCQVKLHQSLFKEQNHVEP